MGQVKTRLTVVDNMTSKLNKINNAINRMQSNFSKLSGVATGASASMEKGAKESTKLSNEMRKQSNAASNAANNNNKNKNSLDNYTNSAKKARDATGNLTTKLKRLANAYLGVMGASAMVQTADAITRTENQLGTLYGQIQPSGVTEEQFTQESLNKIYASAQRARTGYMDMAQNVSKSMVLAGEAFDNNIDNAIRFQEVMAEAYAVGGASAAEQASSMYQMVQALGSGILQGDELRSVREGAPLAYKAIEEFAQGVYDTTDSLKDMASEGKITSDLVVAAINSAGDAMDKQFAKTTMTFAQMWSMFKNDVTKAFEPFFQMLNRIANSEFAQKLYSDVRWVIFAVANALTVLGGIAESVLNFMADHWEIVRIGALAVATVIGVLVVQAIYNALKAWTLMVIKMIQANWQMILISAVVVVVIYLFYQLAQVFGNVAEALGAVLMILGAVIVGVYLLAMAFGIALSPIYLWIALVLIALGAFLLFTEEVVGGAYVMGAGLYNIFLGIYAAYMGYLISMAQGAETFANFFANFLNDPAASVIRVVESMANNILNILKTVATVIDTIFGKNLADTVNGWISSLSGKADELVKRYGNGTYEEKVDLTSKLQAQLDSISSKRWAYSDAWKSGTNTGANIKNTINGWLSGLTDKMFSFEEKIPSIDDFPLNVTTPSTFDPGSLGDLGGDAGKNLDDTAKNTGKIADTMELAEEDLEYIRKVAELEWKKEFTTASITVNMENNNVVNDASDLDGIVQRLTDVLDTELHIVANGVYT